MEVLIPADDSVRLLSQRMEELNYTALYKAYSHRGRKPAVSPEILFKIMVYAYMNGIYTSRGIERACRRDVNFMWLLAGRPAPDHNTIARFRTGRLAGVIEDLFSQVVENLENMGEISFENLFVDGTKIEANANKYSFVWRKAVSKNEVKLKAKLSDFIETVNKTYGFTYTADSPLETILNELSKLASAQGIVFVHGTGKRKNSLQKDIETVEDYISKMSRYSKYQDTFQGRNSFSKTDEDATFMHMKEDHMRNAQLKPGYNVQIGVEGEYIIGMDISQERSDQLTLIPFLKRLEENFKGRKHQNVIADAGYESEENYVYLNSASQKCYIKPANYEKSKTRGYRSNIYLRENMPYDSRSDEYLCPNEKKLVAIGNSSRKSKSGYKANITTYECESCEGCEQKARCTKASGNRRISVSKEFVNYRAESLANITTPLGIQLRMNRSIQVEGAFGVLKYDYGFQRFLTRGKKNVYTEIMLLGLGYNINKLHAKIQENRCGILLHEKKVVA
jgi:transposase